MADWISAADVVAALGVRPQTLYAYASRGRVQTRPDPDDPRRSLYRASDVAQLRARKARGRKPAAVAQAAIAWGEPVLESAISTVDGEQLYYRGRAATALAETATLEDVARLLRGGPPVDAPSQGSALASGPLTIRLFSTLAARAAVDAPALGRSDAALAVEAEGLLSTLADAAAGGRYAGPIHGRLAQAWGVGSDARACDLIRRALVLLADHELNASTFAARVAASTGSSLAACLLAGLSTLSGPRHGGAAAALSRFMAETRAAGAGPTVAARLAEDRGVPGFSHQLYPEGDPRAAHLLARFEAPPAYADLARAVAAATGQAPNVDFALAAMTDALGLPAEAPMAMFAAARSAGWTAHALEQGGGGGLIRPRARYVGEPPAP